MYALGELQRLKAPPSRRHSNNTPPLVEWKRSTAIVDEVVPDGPESSKVSGVLSLGLGFGDGGENAHGGGGLSGFRPARTSRPSPTPSPSLSARRGLVW